MGAGYSYDGNGNMTGDGLNTLSYDAANRALTSSNVTLGSGTYTYDGNGLRVEKISGGVTTIYAFSGSKVIAEYQNGAAPSSPTREYVYAGGALLEKIEGGIATYYHQDQRSNRIETNSSGAVVANLGTYPFGESWYNATNDKLLFTTYERDAESSNDYAMARFYVNRLGRFASPDVLSGSSADPQTLNHYPYSGNDPVNASDPSGMMTLPPLLDVGVLFGPDGDCTEDGLDTSCDSLGSLLSSGGAESVSGNVGLIGGDISKEFDSGTPIYGWTFVTTWSDIQIGDQSIQGSPIEIWKFGQTGTTSGVDFGNWGGIFTTFAGAFVRQAVQALSKPKCRALFNSKIDPAALLLDLAWGNKGGMTTANLGAGINGQTDTVLGPPKMVQINGQTIAQSNPVPQITISSNSSASPNAGTVIHELGHAAELLYGRNASAMLPDDATSGVGRFNSMVNRNLVMANCF